MSCHSHMNSIHFFFKLHEIKFKFIIGLCHNVNSTHQEILMSLFLISLRDCIHTMFHYFMTCVHKGSLLHDMCTQSFITSWHVYIKFHNSWHMYTVFRDLIHVYTNFHYLIMCTQTFITSCIYLMTHYLMLKCLPFYDSSGKLLLH